MSAPTPQAAMPVVRDVADFDRQSGNLLERLVFNNRIPVLLFVGIATLVLGFFAFKLQVNASFERMIPVASPYIQNYFKYRKELPGLGNTIRIVVENRAGDIYDPAYLATLQKLNDTLYLVPGIDRSWMKSLWMPIVRWRQVTEEGVVGGPVMPQDYSGDAASIEKLRANIARANITGSLVAQDQRSTMIVAPLLDQAPRPVSPELARTLARSGGQGPQLRGSEDRYLHRRLRQAVAGGPDRGSARGDGGVLRHLGGGGGAVRVFTSVACAARSCSSCPQPLVWSGCLG